MFDEYDDRLMVPLSSSMAQLAPQCFPKSLPTNRSEMTDPKSTFSGFVDSTESTRSGSTNTTRFDSTESDSATRFVASHNNLKNDQKTRFVQLIDDCMGPLYTTNNGRGWKRDKLEEMSDPGLVYVWYTCGSELSAFISFKIVQDSEKCLYLYEIHVHPKYQGHGWGSLLLESFHNFSKLLNANVASDLPESRHFRVEGTGLTVFSKNARALAWYRKNGYSLAPDSPQDKRLRGKTVQPAYYILYRSLTR